MKALCTAKTRRTMICVMMASLGVGVLATARVSNGAESAARPARAPIYDTQADGGKQIEEALAKAKRENKRVLLKFGANWCGWCHRLSDLFKQDERIGSYLKENYVLVLIDVDRVDGKPHNAEIVQRYGNPTTHGLPVLVVLDADGKQLTTQDTGLLEDGPKHDPQKVMAFLKKWGVRS